MDPTYTNPWASISYLGHKKFNPQTKDFTCAQVWIRLYSFPQEVFLGEVLEGIGNTLGMFVKAVEAKKQRRYISYARIYVYMDVSNTFPGTIKLEYQDKECEKTTDYEHIPFCCRKCN